MSKISAKLTDGYWIPTLEEWTKAAFYKGGNSNQFWTYATQSNTQPQSVTANSNGDGSAGNIGNFANYSQQARWNGTYQTTTVGTNGGSSYYGTYDQNGNVFEWVDTVAPFERGIVKGGGFDLPDPNITGYFLPSAGDEGFGFRIASRTNPLQLPNLVNVGDAGFGNVNYEFMIGKYEITNSEYVEFLNSIATTDTYGLYRTSMGSSSRGGITRSGSPGAYSYATKTNMNNKPVHFLSWFNAARYCNWLTNGKPTGSQNTKTTEGKMYRLYRTQRNYELTHSNYIFKTKKS